LVHAHGEGEVVGRKLEKWIAADIDFVEENSRKKRRQSERLTIGDEVDFVSTLGEGDAKLGRHGAGPTVRRVTSDANLHSAHSRTTARERESSGFTCVTADSGN